MTDPHANPAPHPLRGENPPAAARPAAETEDPASVSAATLDSLLRMILQRQRGDEVIDLYATALELIERITGISDDDQLILMCDRLMLHRTIDLAIAGGCEPLSLFAHLYTIRSDEIDKALDGELASGTHYVLGPKFDLLCSSLPQVVDQAVDVDATAFRQERKHGVNDDVRPEAASGIDEQGFGLTGRSLGA